MAVTRLALVSLVPFATHVSGAVKTGAVLSVAPLLNLARELAALLVPVRPRTQFRADLERSLIAAARQQGAHATLTGYAVSAPHASARFDAVERRWVIGAAAAVGSAVSLAGIVAYMLYRRGDRAA